MSNASTSQGQLQRAGVRSLKHTRKRESAEGGPGSGPHKGNGRKTVVPALPKSGKEPESYKVQQAIHNYEKKSGKTISFAEMKKRMMGQKQESGRIRESYHAQSFTELGEDDKQTQKSGMKQKGRVYLVTIIEEGLGNSKDKNYYSAEALTSGVNVFNGAKAFCDHPDAISEKTLPERTMRALVGWYSDCFTDKNPTSSKVRLRGKLHFFKSAKWLTDMIDAILTEPTAKGLFGISINAIGKTRPAQMGGEQVNYVEEFQRVDSADVVTEPAARGKFDAMLESRRSGVVSLGSMEKKRTREAGILSPEKAKEVADSLVSAYNSDSPDELKQAAFEASKVLHAASSISGKGPGQVNEEQYSNINPSGGSDSMNRQKVKASSGSGGLRFRKKKALRAAAGTGPDNADEGEPEPSDIENELEEADVEDKEGRGELGDQAEFGGGKKYRTVKASSRHASREAFEDEGIEGMEDEGLEGMEDEDEDGGMGMATPSGGSPAAAVPPTPGSSRSVPASAAEADDSEDDSSEMDDGSEEDLSESFEGMEGDEDEHDMMRPGNVAEAGRNRHRTRGREADDGAGQGSTVKKASYAGGLGHSGHTALPKGADPDRGYEDSDEDWGKEDSSTSGTGKSYKIKTSRFARNRAARKIVKPVVREANRRIERLEQFVLRLRESNRAKDRKINRYSDIMRFNESKKMANELLGLAVEKEVLTNGVARQLRESLYGLTRKEQVHEIKMAARLLESATEGTIARLSENVDGAGARGGVVSWRPTGADNSALLEGFASDGIPVKQDE